MSLSNDVNNTLTQLKKAGWAERDIDLLAESSSLPEILEVLRNTATLRISRHVINLESRSERCMDALFGYDFGARFHFWQTGNGLWQWSKDEIELGEVHNSGRHRSDVIEAFKRPLNGAVLDFLFDHQHLIPEEWKGKSIYFCGTTYGHGCDYAYVRYLRFANDEWITGYSCYKPNRMPSICHVAYFKD